MRMHPTNNLHRWNNGQKFNKKMCDMGYVVSSASLGEKRFHLDLPHVNIKINMYLAWLVNIFATILITLPRW